MKKLVGLSAVLCVLAIGCYSKTPANSPESILPLRTLRLYETGVGYYERTGPISQNSSSLPVPAGHLDDALKSLVVLTGDRNSSVHGIEFSTSISTGMARSLAGLPLDASTPISYKDLLSSLKGSAVEVTTSNGVVRGRIVDVLDPEPIAPASDTKSASPSPSAPSQAKPKPQDLTLLLLSDNSEILRLSALEIQSVRPTDPAFSSRIGSTLDALSQRSAQTHKMLRVLASSAAPVTLGYIAETPLWRPTYRLVLDASGQKASLQGWALIHNDTDENWQNIAVQLVNGRPDSFLFPLAAPRYSRRPLIHPDNPLSTVPQLLGNTVDAMWGDLAAADVSGDSIGEAFGAGGLGLSGIGAGGGGRGDGIGGAEKLAESSLLDVGGLANIPRASGVEAGSLFFYKLAERLSLFAHGSALVPFIQEPLEVQPITWVDAQSAARTAVRFVNSTNQTLPAGTIAIFSDGGFAGESAIRRLKPGERSFIEYGADLDLELTESLATAEETVKHYVIENDNLQEHFLRRREVTLEIENRGSRARTVNRPLDVVRNAKVTGTDALDVDKASDRVIAIFRIEPRKKVERKIVLDEGLMRSIPIGSLSVARLKAILDKPELKPEEKAALSEASARQKELEDTIKSQKKAEADLKGAEADIARLREHLKAMTGEKGGQNPGQNPFVQRLLAAEDSLKAVKRKIEVLEAELKQREEAVRAALKKLPQHQP